MSADNSLMEQRFYRFGEFLLDVSERVLQRSGRPVAISPKALEVLTLLVENQGHIVEKQELLDKVWPATFVEENTLAFNISVLRKLLAETASSPRYIETIPKRGYRFIGPVEGVVPEPELNKAVLGSVVAPRTPSLKMLMLAGLLFVLALALAAWRGTNVPKFDNRSTIVLADFSNRTGDPVFDQTLRRGLAVELEQSPYLSLISEQKIRRTLTLMGKSETTSLSGDVAREVCERVGSTAVFEGSIARLGDRYVLSLTGRGCANGTAIYDGQIEANKKEDVLKALTKLADAFRRKAGESAANLREHDTPLDEATTSSLEALKAYSVGWNLLGSQGAAAALPHFERAATIDPNFVMAFASLGRIYADLDQSNLALVNTKRAWAARERVSDGEKFFIQAEYHLMVTGNLEDARQTAETWSQTYPRVASPHFLLSGIPNKVRGNFENAITEVKKGLALEPDFAIGYYNLAVNNAYLNRFAEAEKALQSGSTRGLEDDEMIMLRYELAFLRGDVAGMKSQIARAHSRTGSENWMSHRQSVVLAYSGREREARGMTQEAAEEARHASQPERAALWEACAAVREGLFGNATEAKKLATSTLALPSDRDVKYGTALALALAGESTAAEKIVTELEQQYPDDTSVKFDYLPVLRARLALNRHDAAKALEELQRSAPYELGIPQSAVSGLFGALYPVYMRGQAYLAAGQGLQAAVQFQKILEHRGIVVADPIGALARLQLGRALAMCGDRLKARSAYEDFLALWKNADPSVPVFKQAKAEFARL